MPPPLINENSENLGIPGELAYFVMKEQERSTEKILGIVERLMNEQKRATEILSQTVNLMALSQAEATGALKLLKWSVPIGVAAMITLATAVIAKLF
jgi:hypothetical protein